jgi:enamine deaminase RidA (YjgF/YER057c/UK114 family)
MRRVEAAQALRRRLPTRPAMPTSATAPGAGTTGFDYASMTIAPGIEEQTRQCLRNIEAALREAGSSMREVVRVRYILPDAGEFPAAWPSLRAAFGEIRPAATMIQAGLADPRMRIEIEVDAIIGSA